MATNLPKNLRRKAEKIALAFEYVHDRFFGIPSYRQRLQFLFSKYALPVLALVLITTLPFWGAPARYLLQEAAFQTRAIVRSLLPKPEPTILADAAARNANQQEAQAQRENWQRAIARVPIQGFELVAPIHERLARNPDQFFPQFAPELTALWSFQAATAEPYRNIFLTAARNIRSFVLPFVENEADFPTRVESEVALLHALDNFNRINIPEYFGRNPDRAAALDEFLARGRNLQQSGRRSYFLITSRLQRFRGLDERLQDSADTQEGSIVEALNSFAATRTEERLSGFVETRQKSVLTSAEAGFLAQMAERFRLQLTALDARVLAVEQNRPALIADIKITPTPNVNLGVIQGTTETRRTSGFFGGI